MCLYTVTVCHCVGKCVCGGMGGGGVIVHYLCVCMNEGEKLFLSSWCI